MNLSKAQLEAVRNVLSSKGVTATNEEIRSAASDFTEWEKGVTSRLIADKIVKTRNSLATLENNEQSNNSTEKNTLTTQQRHTLTLIQSQQMGIELNQAEIIEVSQMVADEVSDSIDYLTQVGELIKQFITNRNNQARTAINQKVSDIADIINTGNEQLGDIFNNANKQLNDIVKDCKQKKADYKSPYRDRLESIREILKLPA